MKKKRSSPNVIDNRRARYDYEIRTVYQAGLVLSGAEVKSLRMHHGHLRGAFVTMKGGEAWLMNATITPMRTNAAHLDESIQTKARKLLLKQSELAELQEAKDQGLTVVPLKVLTSKRFIKVEIATARGKRQFDKREVIKKRDEERRMMQENA
jgi:SsrA-binding protein